MTVQQLISHLGECRRRLADLQGRQDYAALTCAILRLEGAGGTVLYEQPFSRILNRRPFHAYMTTSHGETFSVAFYPVADSIQANRIPAALAPVEAITRKIPPLLRELPERVREHLRLPDSDNWWRIVFHLGWHFARPFLSPVRCRLLAWEGDLWGISDETCVQLHGTGGRSDLLPGLIYSALQDNDDLCTCSETAVGIIIDVLERHVQTEQAAEANSPALPAEQRRAFDQLRADFLAGTQLPHPMLELECKLLKLADSFETPPATAWASLQVGGCVERFVTLSRLNDMQEIVQIRGPATEWFCGVAGRAGNALPAWIPDYPILFDNLQYGFRGPRPVMNRNALERWVGFVFATIKRHQHESLCVRWETNMGPLAHGLATLDRDLFAASVLAIDLAGLTTAAEEASNRQRATCSPFSVPSMEEQGFHCAEEVPPPPPLPENYTLGQLVEDLRRFGESYCQAAEQIREQNPVVQKHSRIALGASVSHARDSLQRIPGFTELREQARSLWDEEISFVAARRIVDALVRRSNGSLSAGAVEGLTLPETIALLTAPPEQWETALPERLKHERAEAQARLGAGSVQPAAVNKDRLYVDEVDSFAKVRNVSPSEVARFLKDGYLDQAEDAIQLALESILGVSFHQKDWGGEDNDLYTANVLVNGARRPTAFMLKGNGLKNRTMEVKHCGKNGDQVIRLFRSPADLFVIQFVGNISEAVIYQAHGEVARLKMQGREAHFLIMDGQDTARLMHAYGRL